MRLSRVQQERMTQIDRARFAGRENLVTRGAFCEPVDGELAQRESVLARRREPPDKSYVSSLLTKGVPKINSKISEEAREVTEALVEGDRAHITHEAADVIFHLMVGLEAAGVKVDDVFAELRRHWSEKEVVEIVAAIAATGFVNRWNATMATPLEDEPMQVGEAHLARHGWSPGRHRR